MTGTLCRIGLVVLALTGSALVFASEVRNLRVWAGPDSTRAVLDLDGRVDYRLFTLDDPARVVVDIDGTSIEHQLSIDPERSGVIEAVRHGVRNGSDLRVVFDLEENAKPQSFLLDPAGEYGHRLVIDLTPENAQTATERVREVVRAATTGEREMIVAIDAGHGGEDPGAIGPSGVFEKTVTLAIARALEERINAMPGMRGVLIRTDDYFVPLQERYGRARNAEADLFISIHADAFRDFRVRGSSVYILSRRGASSEAARLLAQSENQSDLIGGVRLDRGDDMLSSVLLDLSQSASLEYSSRAAESVLTQLDTVGRRHRSQVERANFVVLRSPDVPSILVEVGFISNPQDENNLNNPQHRERIAAAIARGVDEHFRQTAPQGTWFANNRTRGRHVVERGDTLGVIARRYQVNVNRLREANGLDDDVIHPGAVLVIPTGS
ncbi:N-acetylmuramoyl-L-alanine amidase [Wenzhouxiangella marina]|uniref:N-acetylmuramoyl-L-alanine amidase AmiC n=2 Tax=Gammaproteobacteria TaxID=1236 RepID=A0A0K0XVM4_9GAMM|nr:N-acetylmuramoyl-L-alanine amidase [Wenzhouxiangella marina]AKS41687.1 Protein hfq [Wenzhouxiangella marina]MBB6086552.1 N-acetylmuramoyl-L-alanine amidase [Wenzhouxiangella marina]